jgi:hypothetical protein
MIACNLQTEAKNGKPAMYLVTKDGQIIGHLEEDAAGWHAFAFHGWKDFGWHPIGDFVTKDAAIDAVAGQWKELALSRVQSPEDSHSLVFSSKKRHFP